MLVGWTKRFEALARSVALANSSTLANSIIFLSPVLRLSAIRPTGKLYNTLNSFATEIFNLTNSFSRVIKAHDLANYERSCRAFRRERPASSCFDSGCAASGSEVRA